MSNHIVKIIKILEDTCNKCGIEYKSPNHEMLKDYQEDAETLAEMYLKLKEIMAELYDMSERYCDIAEIRDLIKNNIDILDKVDHDLIAEARKIVNKFKNK